MPDVTIQLLSIAASSFILALSGALMPGPVMTVTVSESFRRGAVAGPLMILGHGILELALLVALLAGLAPFFARDDVFVSISLLGGFILMWMAFCMFRDLPRTHISFAPDTDKQKNLVLAGILLSISNPYWLIWWATIGLGYIMYSTRFGIPGVAAFFTGHILADLAWYSFISFGIARGRNYFSDRWYRRLIAGCAVFLVIFSGYFMFSGIARLV